MARPVPGIARWLLRLAAGSEHRDALLLDLEEEAAARAAVDGTAAARRWSRRQILASLGPLLVRRAETSLTTLRGIQMRAWRGFGADLAVAGRRLREAPGFTVVCVLTLALGHRRQHRRVHADRSRPAEAAAGRASHRALSRRRHRRVLRELGHAGVAFSLFSYDLYTHLRDAAPEFSHLAAFQANTRAVTIGRTDGDAPADTLNGGFVSGNYFQLFELSPAAGRLIQPDDDARGAAPVAVLSHTAWRDRFQARADILGQPVTLNGVTATIVGVAPDGFYGDTLRPNPTDIWMPLSSEPLIQPAARLLDAKGLHWLYAIGRLKPGAAIPPLQARLTATLQHWFGGVELSPSERAEIPRQRINVIPAASGRRQHAGVRRAIAAAAAGARRRGAADRVRQSGQPAARERRGAADRDGDAGRARRVPDAAGRAAADRVDPAGLRRWRGRADRGVRGSQRDRPAGVPRRHQRAGRSVAVLAGDRLCLRRLAPDRRRCSAPPRRSSARARTRSRRSAAPRGPPAIAAAGCAGR